MQRPVAGGIVTVAVLHILNVCLLKRSRLPPLNPLPAAVIPRLPPSLPCCCCGCRQAVNVGKGGAWLLPFLCAQYGVRPSEACIVGDRLDTDIALGLEGGLLTVLPLTGVTTRVALAAAGPEQQPHVVVKNLAELAGICT